MYQDGVHGLRLRFIYECIVIPVLMALLMQIAVPYAIANVLVIYWGWLFLLYPLILFVSHSILCTLCT